MQKELAVFTSLSLLLAGCRGPTNCAAGEISGMIRIQSASIKSTGSAVPTLTLTNFVRNGQSARPANFLYGIGGDVKNVKIEGDTVICDVACQFATPGKYEFDVSAPGVVSQRVKVEIRGWDAGGCGGVTTGRPVDLNLKFDTP